MINILITGVGGQGCVLVSKILSYAYNSLSYNLKTTETIGMAQRGGSVLSHFRASKKEIYSPLISLNQADLILGFEPNEAIRNAKYLKDGGLIIMHESPIKTPEDTISDKEYNSNQLIDILKSTNKKIYTCNFEKFLEKIGNNKVLNICILGFAIGLGSIKLDIDLIKKAIKEILPDKVFDINIKALEYGYKEGRSRAIVDDVPEYVLESVNKKLDILMKIDGGFYKEKFANLNTEIKSSKDFRSLPFTDKNDLRKAYPLGIKACSDDKIVRVHSSSGTTGKAVIIPYSKKDIDDWADMFKRAYELIGINNNDVVQITPGYGLWTAGIGFQLGCERLGAMALPMGPGNTEKQLQMAQDLGSTVLCATSSYALLLSEEIQKRGLSDKIKFKKAIIGSEMWGDKMRKRIKDNLGTSCYDIYGLTEIYGPGIAISCDYNCGMHYWDDYFYFEIINPQTGEILPDGEYGELVITTLKKEAAPLIRYRTHDITRKIPENCKCGSPFPRIDIIKGRTDDMFKVKAVNMFPKQFEEILAEIDGISSEYHIDIYSKNNKDIVDLYFEIDDLDKKEELEMKAKKTIKSKIGINVNTIAVDIYKLKRSEKKTNRVVDKRTLD